MPKCKKAAIIAAAPDVAVSMRRFFLCGAQSHLGAYLSPLLVFYTLVCFYSHNVDVDCVIVVPAKIVYIYFNVCRNIVVMTIITGSDHTLGSRIGNLKRNIEHTIA